MENKINIDERWKYIDGYEDYIITESGRVYTYRPETDSRGFKGLRELKPKSINNPKRYLSICLSKNDKKKYVQIHRLVGFAFVDGYFEGAVINHKDTNIHNNHYTNLEWVTQKDNINKSYESSGLDQVRNFSFWKLLSPDNVELGVFKGMIQIKDYIKSNEIDCSFTSLQKYKHSNGYKIEAC